MTLLSSYLIKLIKDQGEKAYKSGSKDTHLDVLDTLEAVVKLGRQEIGY